MTNASYHTPEKPQPIVRGRVITYEALSPNVLRYTIEVKIDVERRGDGIPAFEDHVEIRTVARQHWDFWTEPAP